MVKNLKCGCQKSWYADGCLGMLLMLSITKVVGKSVILSALKSLSLKLSI